MNREIKFRAWDGKEMFLSPPEIQFLGVWFDAHAPGALFKGDVVFMQYTGLKDKKEIDIYEGDILRFIGGTCDILPCGIYDHQHHTKGQLLVVRKLASGYTLSMPHHLQYDAPNLVGNIDNYVLWNHASSFEIVGNIYQNEELLTTPPKE